MAIDSNIKIGYKYTESGTIPTDWDVKQLKNLVSTIIDNRGKTPPYSNNPDIELIETASISFVTRFPNYSKVTKFVSSETYKNWFRGHPKKNDVLVSTVGEYSGSSAIMENNRGTVAQNLIALRIKYINPMYIFYWTRSKIFKTQLNQVMMSQAQPSLRVPWLLNFYVNIPKESEQTAIATVLFDTDTLIDHLEKLIDKKKAIKQGTMQQLLTGKKRLPGFSGEWENKKLGEISQIYQPQTISQDVFIDDGYLVYGANGIVGKYSKFNHENWQTTITCRGSTCGTVNKTVNKCWITGNAMVMNVDINKSINKLFFYFLLTNQNFSNCITGSGQPQIVRDPLFEFEIKLPKEKTEQTAIATVLSDMDSEIEGL